LIINSQLEHPRYTVAACPRPDPELPMPTSASEPQPDRHVTPFCFAASARSIRDCRRHAFPAPRQPVSDPALSAKAGLERAPTRGGEERNSEMGTAPFKLLITCIGRRTAWQPARRMATRVRHGNWRNRSPEEGTHRPAVSRDRHRQASHRVLHVL